MSPSHNRPATLNIEALQCEIDAELDRINAQMSTYLPDSEISKFNSQNDVAWFEVSPEFASVVKHARRFSEETEGAFDVTVAPLVNRWNFGPDKTNLEMPSDTEVAALKQAVGFQLIEVRDEPPALRKQRPDVQIDLSAIAKGFAVDRITQLLESRGLNNCMAEIGGEIRVRGTKLGAHRVEGRDRKAGCQCTGNTARCSSARRRAGHVGRLPQFHRDRRTPVLAPDRSADRISRSIIGWRLFR